MKVVSAALLVSLLVGCTSIDRRVEGFPQDLEIVKHENLSFMDVQRKCWKYMPLHYKLLGGFTLACAEVDLDAHRCDVYLMRDSAKWVIRHEEEHCRGGDHNGQLQEYFDSWTSQQ